MRTPAAEMYWVSLRSLQITNVYVFESNVVNRSRIAFAHLHLPVTGLRSIDAGQSQLPLRIAHYYYDMQSTQAQQCIYTRLVLDTLFIPGFVLYRRHPDYNCISQALVKPTPEFKNSKSNCKPDYFSIVGDDGDCIVF